jgi:hypothetical protein
MASCTAHVRFWPKADILDLYLRLVPLSKIVYKSFRFGLATTARLAAAQPSVVSLLMELRHVLWRQNLYLYKISLWFRNR